MLLLFAHDHDSAPGETAERVRVVLSRAAKRLELARHCPTCHPTYLYLLILTILTTLRMTR
jgi:hypothetical protein